MTEAKYSTHTYNLSIERVDTPVNLSGGSINVLAVKGDCFIKINDKSQDPINLLHTANIKTKFTKFYLSNNVQVGGYVTIVISKHCEFELTTNIAQATHGPLLLPPQNIPSHLRDRAICEPEVINVWDIENATLRHSFNIREQDLGQTDLFFRPDGLKVYTVGQQHRDINEYDLNIAWDISSVVFKHSFNVGTQGITNLFFSPDGGFMYVVNSITNEIYFYVLSTKWNVTTATLQSTFVTTAYIDRPSSIVFNSTGYKMYIISPTSNYIYEFDLNIAWDIQTTIFRNSFNIPSLSESSNIFFSPDGLKFYVLRTLLEKVMAYRLLTAWDVTTAVFHQSFDYNLILQHPVGLFFKPCGSKMYILSATSHNIYEFDL